MATNPVVRKRTEVKRKPVRVPAIVAENRRLHEIYRKGGGDAAIYKCKVPKCHESFITSDARTHHMMSHTQ